MQGWLGDIVAETGRPHSPATVHGVAATFAIHIVELKSCTPCGPVLHRSPTHFQIRSIPRILFAPQLRDNFHALG